MRSFITSVLSIEIKILLLISFGFELSSFAQNVYIPNANFKNLLLATAINADGDTNITYAEAAAATGSITLFDMQLGDITGISAFSGITGLNCAYNSLTQLDVSGCTSLTYLDCGYNSISSLDVSNSPALYNLFCGYNQLTNLNVSSNINMMYLGCGYNLLTSLDLSACLPLVDLRCQNNQISGTFNLANLLSLKHVECQTNQITDLILLGDTALEYLSCGGNLLPSLDVSNYPSLSTLYCGGNLLTSLDVTNNIELVRLGFGVNSISTINLLNNPLLEILGCDLNYTLTDFEISHLTELMYFYASSNNLTQLNFSNNLHLSGEIRINDNNLTTLNLRNGHNTSFYPKVNNNLNLTCIDVDDTAYSNQNWTQIDSLAYFSEDCTVGFSEKATTKGVLLYPNPTNGEITLSNLSGNSIILVYNQTGNLIKNIKTNEKIFNLDLDRLEVGMYIISVREQGTTKHFKVIKTN